MKGALKAMSLPLDTSIITSCFSSTFKPPSFASGDRTATPFPSCLFPSPPFPSPLTSASGLAYELSQPRRPSSPPLLPKCPYQQEIRSPKSKVICILSVVQLNACPPVMSSRCMHLDSCRLTGSKKLCKS